MPERPSSIMHVSSPSHRRLVFAARVVAALCLIVAGLGPARSAEMGRLFFTPVQRAQLEAARARVASGPGPRTAAPPSDRPAPLRYDGVLIRSDGKTTRWVDGAAQFDGAAPAGLKPGQIRAGGKVYEPYQLLRPRPADPATPEAKESAP